MQFVETRGNDPSRASRVAFSEAILDPMASFGGLYVPESFPDLGLPFLATHIQASYKELARDLLASFDLDIEQSLIDAALDSYDTFDNPANPAPLSRVEADIYVSELYHGPTRSFKDMALQPFGVIFSALAQQRDAHYLILVATSGDTGPATFDTFRNHANVRVACLYPENGTSDVQRLQMVTEDADNLKAIGIRGSFDDAQGALKSLLGSETFHAALRQKGTHLSAANSVNFGRIIFQQIYHMHSYLELVRQGAVELGEKVCLSVPSGNFGNALGGYYAMKMGLPVEKIVISSNRNNVLTDLINKGEYDLRDRSVVTTTSPAMDILKSSNVERLLFDLFGAERTRELMTQLDNENRYTLNPTELERLQDMFAADYCTDAQGKHCIRHVFRGGYLIDPHTATCFKAHASHRNPNVKMIVCATAEWSKFSPTIANALNDEPNTHDIDALKVIAQAAKTTIPTRISTLFEKPICQETVVDKERIEEEVLGFIQGNA